MSVSLGGCGVLVIKFRYAFWQEYPEGVAARFSEHGVGGMSACIPLVMALGSHGQGAAGTVSPI